MSKKVLGVIGGMGPKATVLFLDLLVDLRHAPIDQDNLDTITISQSSIPDRTAYILDPSQPSPLPDLVRNAKRLEKAGCDYLAIPCNTSHYFYPQISAAVSVPVLNMVEETVKMAKSRGGQRMGFLGTEGTDKTGLYRQACERAGMTYLGPDKRQKEITRQLIYEQVKADQPIDDSLYQELLQSMRDRGADIVVTGCTELSVVNYQSSLGDSPWIVDSLYTLAKEALAFAGLPYRRSAH